MRPPARPPHRKGARAAGVRRRRHRPRRAATAHAVRRRRLAVAVARQALLERARGLLPRAAARLPQVHLGAQPAAAHRDRVGRRDDADPRPRDAHARPALAGGAHLLLLHRVAKVHLAPHRKGQALLRHHALRRHRRRQHLRGARERPRGRLCAPRGRRRRRLVGCAARSGEQPPRARLVERDRREQRLAAFCGEAPWGIALCCVCVAHASGLTSLQRPPGTGYILSLVVWVLRNSKII
mmetsp:Transcript_20223/g.66933  ORF Transcript_20223/g.66933 Transcript_20223/m.66933 type:complete len:239 (+) Transcript_20223:768-1484(+)